MVDDTGFPTTEFFERLGRRLEADAEFSVHGRFLDLRLAFLSGSRGASLGFQEGRLVTCEEGAGAPEPDLSFSGSPEDWDGFLAEEPAPGYVDVIGMDRLRPSFSIGGDRVLLARHLRALSRLLRLAQLEGAGSPGG
jgi:hypothetical protein